MISVAFQAKNTENSTAHKIRRMKRRELTPEEKKEALRLAELWREYKAANKGATQEWLGHETGIGGQSAVGQYLRGIIPLNLEALFAFSRVLRVEPMAISPRLAANVSLSQPVEHEINPNVRDVYYSLDRQKIVLLDLFDALTPKQKGELIRELEEKKQTNDQLLEELLSRESEKKAS